MTVSSVKNLNGETFSAVQDASLTDIVSSNSANWNEISAYQANSASYLQDTDLTIVDNKITEISGVPLSAGDELPSGVMNTSALEYNAVNEISGYNGSAIAQYGAEKQWLVHDDTLVHVANSAQYALGVNLSAVAQLLGVDETVLFSGNATSAATITEDIHNFNTVQLHIQHANYGPAQVITLNPETMDTTGYFAITRPRGGENLNVAYIRFEIDQTGISAVNSKCIRFGTWSNTTATGSNVDINNAEDRNSIIRVVGIGRKQ